MKKVILTLAGAFFACAAIAQPLVSVHDLQTWPGQDLSNCDDRPNPAYCDVLGTPSSIVVKVRGIVMVKGGIAQTTSVGNRQIWIHDVNDYGPFSTLGVRPNTANPTSPSDILDLVEGDTVEITGRMQEFLGSTPANGESETQIVPNPDGVQVIGRTGPAPQPKVLSIGVFNDANGYNVLPTGEQYEGAYVNFRDVIVTATSNFTDQTTQEQRWRFDIQDAQGNVMQVNDRFAAMRTRNGWIAPNVGDRYTGISGIIIHQKNNCPVTSTFNRGYTLAPFDASHFVLGAAAPSIGSLHRTPYTPAAQEKPTVTARIISANSTVTGAKIWYTTGDLTTYTSTDMTQVGTTGTYTVQLPGYDDGTYVKYYVSATDANNQVANFPNVPGNTAPIGYFVHSDGTHISDVQFSLDATGRSAIQADTVTLNGYVTSQFDSTNLGTIFIQQSPTASALDGIWLQPGNPDVEAFTIGQKVRVTGIVSEWRNVMTSLVNITQASVITATPTQLTPLSLSSDEMNSYNALLNEKYEGVYVKVHSPVGDTLYVCDTNVVVSSGVITPGTNFGEYRMGPDPGNASRGVIILTGRQSATSFSSLNATNITGNYYRQFQYSASNPHIVQYGDKANTVSGLIFQSFGTIKVMPRNTSDFQNAFITGIAKDFTAAGYSLFPNPATGKLTVATKTAGKNHSISLSSLTGVTLKVMQSSAAQSSMDISNLAAGVYVINVQAEGEKAYRTRVVVY
ncbi:MAG: T9SS type A sorting domain-containing protein [Bacteroidota bacterium]